MASPGTTASATPLAAAREPWHDGNTEAEASGGRRSTGTRYLERYVMLVNRARNESFDNEGIYVAYAATLDDPGGWSTPRKLMSGGGWYPRSPASKLAPAPTRSRASAPVSS